MNSIPHSSLCSHRALAAGASTPLPVSQRPQVGLPPHQLWLLGLLIPCQASRRGPRPAAAVPSSSQVLATVAPPQPVGLDPLSEPDDSLHLAGIPPRAAHPQPSRPQQPQLQGRPQPRQLRYAASDPSAAPSPIPQPALAAQHHPPSPYAQPPPLDQAAPPSGLPSQQVRDETSERPSSGLSPAQRARAVNSRVAKQLLRQVQEHGEPLQPSAEELLRRAQQLAELIPDSDAGADPRRTTSPPQLTITQQNYRQRIKRQKAAREGRDQQQQQQQDPNQHPQQPYAHVQRGPEAGGAWPLQRAPYGRRPDDGRSEEEGEQDEEEEEEEEAGEQGERMEGGGDDFDYDSGVGLYRLDSSDDDEDHPGPAHRDPDRLAAGRGSAAAAAAYRAQAAAAASGISSYSGPGSYGPIADGASRPPRAELERLVRGCSTLEQLRLLYRRQSVGLSRQELVLFVNQLANMHMPQMLPISEWAAVQTLLVELLQRVTPHMPALGIQEFVVVAAAVAKLRYVPPRDWVTALLVQSRQRLWYAGPGFLTTMLRAVSRMGAEPSSIKSASAFSGWMGKYMHAVNLHMPKYRANELVKTLTSLAELRYRPSPEWMGKLAGALQQRVPAMEVHDITACLLAWAQLGYRPDPSLLRPLYSVLSARLPLADDRDLAAYAQAVAASERLLLPEFMQEFLPDVLAKLPTFKAQYLANLVAALGRLAAKGLMLPQPGWTAAVGDHVARRMSTFSGPAFASTLWGLSMMGHAASPAFLDAVLSSSYGKLHTCSAAELTMLLSALGNYGYAPPPGRGPFWVTWLREFERLAGRKHYDLRGACDLMAALARVPRPSVGAGKGSSSAPFGPVFLSGVLRSTRMGNLRATSPERLASLAGSLAVLGVRPDFGFLYNYAQACRIVWTSFSPRDFATMLTGLVSLGTPGLADPMWASDMLLVTACKMQEFDGQALASTLAALQRLPKPEFEPSSQWLAAAAQRARDLLMAGQQRNSGQGPLAPATSAAQPPLPPLAQQQQRVVLQQQQQYGLPALGLSAAGGPLDWPPAAAEAVVGPLTNPSSSQARYQRNGPASREGLTPAAGMAFANRVAQMAAPLTAGQLCTIVVALADLGYTHTQPAAAAGACTAAAPVDPLVVAARALLARNDATMRLREAAGEATAEREAQEPTPQQHAQQAAVSSGGSGGSSHGQGSSIGLVAPPARRPASAANAFEQARAMQAATAAHGGDMPQQPLLSGKAAAQLHQAVARILGLPPPAGAAQAQPQVPAAAGAAYGLPGGVARKAAGSDRRVLRLRPGTRRLKRTRGAAAAVPSVFTNLIPKTLRRPPKSPEQVAAAAANKAARAAAKAAGKAAAAPAAVAVAGDGQ